jgi:predicted GTPase|tara:strand:+ start:1591 stop:1704 length:114 start_codon:yes stop_codon:yes gene_type:complete
MKEAQANQMINLLLSIEKKLTTVVNKIDSSDSKKKSK